MIYKLWEIFNDNLVADECQKGMKLPVLLNKF